MSIMFVAMMADLLDMATATAWMDGARCAQADPEEWFPHPGEHSTAAKAICADCPIRERCLEYARAEEIPYGTWGGLTAAERLPDQGLAA
jgi:WhiB family redox-sensing transcriptional regulator